MVGKIDYSSVPTSMDLENNSHQKKYTINKHHDEKGLVISKALCALMVIGAILLAILVGLIVFFVVPRECTNSGGVGENNEIASMIQKDGTNDDDVLLLNDKLMENGYNEIEKRLPRNILPSHYKIEIKPNFQQSTFEGQETITLHPTEETDTIIFHINKIDIDKSSVNLTQITNITSPEEIFSIESQDHLDGQRYKIVFDINLEKDIIYTLNLKYHGQLNNQLQGFYKSEYTNGTNTRFTGSTQFSPTDARRAFPCFDEPSFKAKFSIKIARPGNLTSLSNMPLERSELLPNYTFNQEQWYLDHYQETPKMSTYLVAFLISDFKSFQSSQDRSINIWTKEEYLIQSEYASRIAPKILRYFENYFEINYPLPKMDIVAIPDFGFSAMENWGLITFRESSLLFDRDSSTVEDQRTIATVLSHEIAHQWFGNLATPKWWNDLWLKEGFATYLQYLGVNNAEPSWKILEEFLPSEMSRAMDIDSLESSAPISFDVKNSRQIKETFNEISYAKGACIIRMMNHFLNEKNFRSGLIKYLQKFKYSNADRNDLFTTLTEEAQLSGSLPTNMTVEKIMDSWTKQPGFPVINVRPDYTQNILRISQKRFLLNSSSKLNNNLKWWIPISYTSSLTENFYDTKPKFWIKSESEIIEKVDPIGNWYLLNLNQTGYFIVNYDEHNWEQLSKQIITFPPLIRAQLLSDSMELARANQLHYGIPLKMLARMATQDRAIMFIPTIVAFNKLKYLSDILYDTPAFGLFEEYQKSIFKDTYRTVDFSDNVDDYITKRIRHTVLQWSCRTPESFCVHQTRSRFRNWMVQGKTIPPNLRTIVYCTAIREGSELEWNFAYEKFLETTSPGEKNVLLDALGCTKLKWLLSRYLNKLIDGSNSIRIQDADRVFESVSKNKEGTLIAFDFIRKNWNELLNHFGDGFNILGKMIQSLAVHMNNEFQLDELIRFKNKIKGNISTTTKAFNNAIETVKANVDWMKKNYQQVEDWLRRGNINNYL